MAKLVGSRSTFRFVGLVLLGVLFLVAVQPRVGAQGAPEFPRGVEWLNSKPLNFRNDLKGKFVLLDFWTYCCINCMHILPELKKLEDRFPNELVVIGVHSAKFEEEKLTENIRSAILRYEIKHPVINDSAHQVWESFGVNSWPTIILIDPQGKVIGKQSGEFKAADLEKFFTETFDSYKAKGLVDETPIRFDLESEKEEVTPLRFPGKVLADAPSDRLFVADSNHNRIVVSTLDGKLLNTIGFGTAGLKDGDFASAQFDHPQGMALNNGKLYVADTENHAIRKIDLETKKVTTIAGTGSQSRNGFPSADRTSFRVSKAPKKTDLSSPWDLWVHGDHLYIAMAGPHNIWRLTLDERVLSLFAGNGREDIVDGALTPGEPYGAGSSFAQPSGLSSDGTSLFVADSEGSSIRAIPLDGKGKVTTPLGSASLPYGRLFAFDDIDGAVAKARLQHALGVAYHDGMVYIADTYNNKIKALDLDGRKVTTIAGDRQQGSTDEPPRFDEPAGLSIAGETAYIADTNNHLIRTLDLKSKKVKTLIIEGLRPPGASGSSRPFLAQAPTIKVSPGAIRSRDGEVTIQVRLKIPTGWKINPLGRQMYAVERRGDQNVVSESAYKRTRVEPPSENVKITLPVSGQGEERIRLPINYYLCQTGDEAVCIQGGVAFELDFQVSDNASMDSIEIPYEAPAEG